MKTLLEVHNLAKEFNKGRERFSALMDVSFSIAYGELLGLVGPSGSGKTTIGRILVGLLPASAGKITLEGKQLSYPFAENIRPSLQMVFQEPGSSLSPRLKIMDLLTEPLLLNDIPQDKAETSARSMIKEMGLKEEYLDRYYWELSGGEIQRVALARAMVLEPELVVLDEISSGLDPITANEILNLIKKLSNRNKTSMLLITHDLGLAWRYCQRILFIFAGTIAGEISSNKRDLTPEAQSLLHAALNRQDIFR
jgi:ABC-type dipeptide/oligopeptide/nickel transport system ATPase subunit